MGVNVVITLGDDELCAIVVAANLRPLRVEPSIRKKWPGYVDRRYRRQVAIFAVGGRIIAALSRAVLSPVG